MTTTSTNPSSIYLGTTWQKIENRFLLGTSSSGASKQTGGSNTKAITQANLPDIKLNINSFSLSRGTMNITGELKAAAGDTLNTGAFGKSTITDIVYTYQTTKSYYYNTFDASKTWTGTTSTAQPQTVNLGSGQALDITPSYYTCHMWLRLT